MPLARFKVVGKYLELLAFLASRTGLLLSFLPTLDRRPDLHTFFFLSIACVDHLLCNPGDKLLRRAAAVSGSGGVCV
jgi:hypothetical protein